MTIYVVTETEVYEYGDCVEIKVTAYCTQDDAEQYVKATKSPYNITTFEVHKVEVK